MKRTAKQILFVTVTVSPYIDRKCKRHSAVMDNKVYTVKTKKRKTERCYYFIEIDGSPLPLQN